MDRSKRILEERAGERKKERMDAHIAQLFIKLLYEPFIHAFLQFLIALDTNCLFKCLIL